MFAVIFFLLLLAIAIAAEALDWVEDPAKIYDFAGLVLAVVIGYTGGEVRLVVADALDPVHLLTAPLAVEDQLPELPF